MICHLVHRAAWERAEAAGRYAPPSLAAEGFIHLSTPEQLLATAARWFPGARDLLVLVVDPAALDAPLRWEAPPERPDERYPHLYGELPLAAVRAALPLELDASGRFIAPALRA